jgi:hypothetical protein
MGIIRVICQPINLHTCTKDDKTWMPGLVIWIKVKIIVIRDETIVSENIF